MDIPKMVTALNMCTTLVDQMRITASCKVLYKIITAYRFNE